MVLNNFQERSLGDLQKVSLLYKQIHGDYT